MREKTRVLLLAADPFPETRLRLEKEVRAIDAAIQRGSARDELELVPHFAVRVQDLQAVLLRHRPQVVHFAGHGDFSGGIVLGDETDQPQNVDRNAINVLFGTLANPPRVVVLNACSTLTAEDTGGSVVDVTVGMNNRIGDSSAILFAEAFYGALAERETVARSFAHGVVRLQLERSPDATIPVLRIRAGVDPETIRLVRPRPGDRGHGASPGSRSG
jgi:CHAT domain-containing protein